MKPCITLKFIRPKLITNLRERLNGYAMVMEESISNDFSQFYAEHAIIHVVTPPYLPQSNGVAEREKPNSNRNGKCHVRECWYVL
jgi:hypothetical protein